MRRGSARFCPICRSCATKRTCPWSMSVTTHRSSNASRPRWCCSTAGAWPPPAVSTCSTRRRRNSRHSQSRPPSARGHALVLELLDRALVLRQVGEPHPAQHVRGLGELDVVVADDLYSVAPGVAEIEEWAGQRLDPRRRQRAADRVLVVDHEAKMTTVVGGLGAPLLQRKELIAQVDEGRGLALAAQFEVKQAAVECQRLLDIADLEGDVVETDGVRFSWLRHGGSPTIRAVIMW